MEGQDGNRFRSHTSGSYRIGPNGRLVLVDQRTGRKRVATLAVLTDGHGRMQGRKRGVYLLQSIDPRHGKDFVDGNHLRPVG